MSSDASHSAGHYFNTMLARWQRTKHQWLVVLIVVLTVWGLTDVRRRARIDPLDESAHKSDLTVYTEAGEAFFDGRDPYAVTNPRGWHYLYPPLFAIAIAPLSLLDTQAQAVVWFFLSVLACWGCIVECERLLRMMVTRESQQGEVPLTVPPWLMLCVAGAMLVPFLNCLQRGQVGSVVLYFLVLGLRLTLESKSWKQAAVGGIVLALPVAIKLTPILPVGVLLLQLAVLALAQNETFMTRIRAFGTWGGVAAGGLLFLIVLPSVAVGPIDNLNHLNTWVDRVVVSDEVGDENDFNERSKRNQSLENSIERLGNWAVFTFAGGPDDRLVEDLDNVDVVMPMEHDVVAWGIRLLRLVLIVGLLIAGWRAVERADEGAMLAVCALACPLTLLVSPLSWVHHYTMWLPALVLVPRLQWIRGATRAAAWTVAVPVALVWAHYTIMDVTGRLGLLGIGTAAWFVAATTWVHNAARCPATEQTALTVDPHSHPYATAA